MNENWDSNQRFDLHISDYTVIFLADSVQSFRCFIRSKRCKQNLNMAVRIGGTNIVLYILGTARKRVVHVTVQYFVELQDVVTRNWNRIEVFVNNTQDIAIPCNLLFITVPWRSLLLNKLPNPCIRGDNALNGIRCFGALYLSNFNELFELFWALFQIQFLLTRFLVYGSNQSQNVRIPLLLLDCGIIE